MSNGLGVNREKLFGSMRLQPFIPHHREYIEQRLAGMRVNATPAAQESCKEFTKFYLSFGVRLAGVDEEPTFERARDEEKIAAGWEPNEEGVLEPPKAKKAQKPEPPAAMTPAAAEPDPPEGKAKKGGKGK